MLPCALHTLKDINFTFPIINGTYIQLRLKCLHCLDMGHLIIPNCYKDIVKILYRGTAQLTLRLELIKHIKISVDIIIDRRLGCGHPLELLFVFLQVFIIGSKRVLFHILIEIISLDGVDKIQCYDNGVVAKGNVLGKESIEKILVPAQFLHDEEVMQFIPSLSEVELEVLGTSPSTQRFIEVENGQVGEVRDAGDSFQGVESGEGAIFSREESVEDGVFEEADGESIRFLDTVG
mmetsp:Transcript_22186/g.35288  ORF Transcript_22186/g.35288 Transcript_22186/m.35288 type:complete len:235 (+) Transcript_22186:169-873(+)